MPAQTPVRLNLANVAETVLALRLETDAFDAAMELAQGHWRSFLDILTSSLRASAREITETFKAMILPAEQGFSAAIVSGTEMNALLGRIRENIRRIGGDAEGETKSVERFIKALSGQVAGVDPQQILQLYEQLRLAGKRPAEALRFIAEGFDLAASRGMNLAQAVDAIRDAYKGMPEQLGRILGVQTKLMSAQQAQARVLGELQKQTRGFAEAISQEDPYTKIRQMFEQIRTEAGQALEKAVRPFFKEIYEQMKVLQAMDWSKVFDALVKYGPAAGKEFASAFWDGLKTVWPSIIAWVKVQIASLIEWITGEAARFVKTIAEGQYPLIKSIAASLKVPLPELQKEVTGIAVEAKRARRAYAAELAALPPVGEALGAAATAFGERMAATPLVQEVKEAYAEGAQKRERQYWEDVAQMNYYRNAPVFMPMQRGFVSPADQYNAELVRQLTGVNSNLSNFNRQSLYGGGMFPLGS
jgi:hypothetical protein